LYFVIILASRKVILTNSEFSAHIDLITAH